MSSLSRKCGSLDVSQPYGPPRSVTGIALLFMKTFIVLIFHFRCYIISLKSRRPPPQPVLKHFPFKFPLGTGFKFQFFNAIYALTKALWGTYKRNNILVCNFSSLLFSTFHKATTSSSGAFPADSGPRKVHLV
jgi:hypothetical protein